MKRKQSPESLAYHASRLLILIATCGRPQNREGVLPGVEGRMLLAKLDFFLRYPSYLVRASAILGYRRPEGGKRIEDMYIPDSIESRMVRYLYGPWDHLYYPVLAYLIGKGLIGIEIRRNTEIFRLTRRGLAIAAELQKQDTYTDLVQRGKLVRTLFHNFSGSRLKDFIYNHFPEIVAREIGGTI